MKLKELLADVTVLKATADMEQEILHVAYDSRKVQNGGMLLPFPALPPTATALSPWLWKRALLWW